MRETNYEEIIRCSCKCPTCNSNGSFLTKAVKAGIKIFTARNARDASIEGNEQLIISQFDRVMKKIMMKANEGHPRMCWRASLYPEVNELLVELGYVVGEIEDAYIGQNYRVISWEK
jgi:hypothetical protein